MVPPNCFSWVLDALAICQAPDASSLASAVDLEQVLYCPTLTHSSVFYQRQLATYNYAIHDAAEGNATMMLWHEAMAHRGSTEIASSLLFYIWQNFDPLQHGQERKLIVWSDRILIMAKSYYEKQQGRLMRLWAELEEKKLEDTIGRCLLQNAINI
nr:unnamed protein product [Callosobruchus analis]